MCGFAGYYLHENYLNFDEKTVLRAMGNQIAHRGPDDEQIQIEENFGLIFRRLSIVDIEGGRQPFKNEKGTITLVVNGEIYNYRDLIKSLKDHHTFTSQSDCEVLVHLYEEKGLDFLKDINGMFSLALWDTEKKQFILARDRLGIKPLYYSNNKNRLLFGSELKALIPFPDCSREFNWAEALDNGKKRLVPDNFRVETYFQDIEQLKGGQYLLIKANSRNLILKDYWSIFDSIPNDFTHDHRSSTQIIREYRDLLADSVNLMLLGDVDVGLFLSGGIDSSAIAALASKTTKLKTFSVLNNDTLESGDSIFANQVANSLGLDNYQVAIRPDVQIYQPDFWKNLVWQCETYECGTEQLFKFELSRYVKNHFPALRVILLGQGSDEYNGGYAHKYVGENHPERLNKWHEFALTTQAMERNTLTSGKFDGLKHYSRLLNPDYLAAINENSVKSDSLYAYLNMHSKGLQLYQLLHEDRTAMANSIENRVPFLDHRIVEFLVKVNPKHFPELFWNKNILRRGMQTELDPAFCERPKVPFIFDNKNNSSKKFMAELMRHNHCELFDYAFGAINSSHDVLNRKALGKFFKQITAKNNYQGIDDLRFLMNMGILSRKVTEKIDDIKFPTESIKCDPISYHNKTQEQQSAYLKLFKQTNLKRTKKGKYDIYIVPSAELLTDTQGTWYLFVDGDLIEMISENEETAGDWIKVLRSALGNGHNVSQALVDLGIERKLIAHRLSKSLESKVLYKIVSSRHTTPIF
jgi:asparagine synthase (glutamine-hydrolysing)